jgi:hypothetical protein
MNGDWMKRLNAVRGYLYAVAAIAIGIAWWGAKVAAGSALVGSASSSPSTAQYAAVPRRCLYYLAATSRTGSPIYLVMWGLHQMNPLSLPGPAQCQE